MNFNVNFNVFLSIYIVNSLVKIKNTLINNICCFPTTTLVARIASLLRYTTIVRLPVIILV